MEGRDFDVVEDLLADLIERHRDLEAIDVAGSVDVGLYAVDVVAAGAVVGMLTRAPTDSIVLALGRT